MLWYNFILQNIIDAIISCNGKHYIISFYKEIIFFKFIKINKYHYFIFNNILIYIKFPTLTLQSKSSVIPMEARLFTSFKFNSFSYKYIFVISLHRSVLIN